MTLNGWIQIAIYCAIIVALVKPLGWYMTAVFNGERTFLSPILRPVEAGLYRLGGVDEKRRAGLAHLHRRHAALSCRWLSDPLRPAAPARLPAVQSARHDGGAGVSQLQHRDQLHHQHQLAELRWREHAVLSRADARPHAPELSVGGDRHRARRGADPRLRARFLQDDRKFLGRYHPLHPLHPPADLHSLRPVPRLAGHAADLGRLCRRNDARRRQADHRGRPGRLAGRHQDARHQWRRLLQCQRGAPLRESDRAVQFVPDRVDLRHRRRAHQCVRPHGRRPAPRLGHLRRHGRYLRRRRPRHLLGRGSGQSAIRKPRARSGEHGRQGGALRRAAVGSVRGDHHGCLLRRRQCHARQLHARLAA